MLYGSNELKSLVPEGFPVVPQPQSSRRKRRLFQLRRFASPSEKQSRQRRPINSNQRFEYDCLVRGHNSRHWRESAHLPLDSFGVHILAGVLIRIFLLECALVKKEYAKGSRGRPQSPLDSLFNNFLLRNKLVAWNKPFMPIIPEGFPVALWTPSDVFSDEIDLVCCFQGLCGRPWTLRMHCQ